MFSLDGPDVFTLDPTAVIHSHTRTIAAGSIVQGSSTSAVQITSTAVIALEYNVMGQWTQEDMWTPPEPVRGREIVAAKISKFHIIIALGWGRLHILELKNGKIQETMYVEKR